MVSAGALNGGHDSAKCENRGWLRGCSDTDTGELTEGQITQAW